MKKVLVLFCTLALAGAAHGQKQKEVTPESCAKAGLAYLSRGGIASCVPHAGAQTSAPQETKLPNGDVLSISGDGEVWVTIHINGKPLAIEIAATAQEAISWHPYTGEFQTFIVYNLPPSDIVNAPQSVDVDIWGYCQSKTYTVIGTLPYEGKMRAGAPEVELETGPEGVMRRVEPGSVMEKVFHTLCKR